MSKSVRSNDERSDSYLNLPHGPPGGPVRGGVHAHATCDELFKGDSI
jgi:hypothetical protein